MRVIIYLFITVVSFSCRKEIVHNVGTIDLMINPENSTGSWELVSSVYTDLKALKTYNNELYLGGEFELSNGFEKIMKYNGSSFIPVLSGSFYGDGVSTIDVINNQLYIGGDFTYLDYPTSYDNLMIFSPIQLTGFEFGNIVNVKDFIEFNGDVIVGGYFSASSANLNTANIERISNNQIIGFHNQGITNTVNALEVFNSELYASLDGSSSNKNLIVKWNGTNWISQFSANGGYSNNSSDLIKYGNDLYATKFTNYGTNNCIQKMNGNGSWLEFSGIETSGKAQNKLFSFNGKLYLAGEKISFAGALISNVLMYNGSTWTTIGEFKQKINDLELFNGELYLASDIGLYKFEK